MINLRVETSGKSQNLGFFFCAFRVTGIHGHREQSALSQHARRLADCLYCRFGTGSKLLVAAGKVTQIEHYQTGLVYIILHILMGIPDEPDAARI